MGTFTLYFDRIRWSLGPPPEQFITLGDAKRTTESKNCSMWPSDRGPRGRGSYGAPWT